MKKLKMLVAGIILGVLLSGVVVYAESVISGNLIGYDHTNSKLSATTVQEAIDEVYSKTLYVGKIQLGDYVKITPVLTNYEISGEETGCINGVTCGTITDGSPQVIHPNELTVWRVISINSDGTADLVSEYASNNDIYFHGKIGYINYVGTLNKIASAYANSKYVLRTRHVGYGGATQYLVDIENSVNSNETVAPWAVTTGKYTTVTQEMQGAGDLGFWQDVNVINNVLKTSACSTVDDSTTNVVYWLASRNYGYFGDNEWYYRANTVSTNGTIYPTFLYYYSEGWGRKNYSYHIRPIITLKSGLITNGGDGQSEATAWTFQ